MIISTVGKTHYFFNIAQRGKLEIPAHIIHHSPLLNDSHGRLLITTHP